MKYEETTDMTTILMEPADEVEFVTTWIGERCHPARPVVLILPVNASELFGHPETLYALRHLRDERVGTILLVIPGNVGNERLRSWATLQGFPVFATVETCTWTLAQHGPLSVQQQQELHGAEGIPRHAQRVRASTSGSLTAPEPQRPAPISAFAPSDLFQPAYKITDDLARRKHKSNRKTEPLILKDGPTAARLRQRRRQDTFLLLLVALLILGILGGIGFGYLLTLAHYVPQALLPVQLFY